MFGDASPLTLAALAAWVATAAFGGNPLLRILARDCHSRR
jgi:hypothetical protein